MKQRYIAVAYMFLCKLNYGYHNQAVFIEIFQTEHCEIGYGLGTTSELNRWLTGGSIRFRPVSFVLNNDNHPEPIGTASQPVGGFWSRPLWKKCELSCDTKICKMFGKSWKKIKLKKKLSWLKFFYFYFYLVCFISNLLYEFICTLSQKIKRISKNFSWLLASLLLSVFFPQSFS